MLKTVYFVIVLSLFLLNTVTTAFFFLSDQDKQLWQQQAERLDWYSRWNEVYGTDGSSGNWFSGATINASYVCLDVHIKAGHHDDVALQWCSESGERATISYNQLYELVNAFAAALIDRGVKKGDMVAIYMPMIPEAIVAMLACARLGAVHCVIFSGFGYQALRDRIVDSQATHIITTDIAYYRGKKLHLKSIVDQALEAKTTVGNVMVFQRGAQDSPIMSGRDYIVKLSTLENSYVQPVPVESNQPLFILHTSGTTGKPKGIVHSTGGYLTYVFATLDWVFGIRQSDIYWCTADIGWITGHSYVVYGPLMHGATIILREGAPDYPDAAVWCKLVDHLKITIFYTSPTVLRMFMRLGDSIFDGIDLSSLRVLGSVGEPIGPEVWHWFYERVGSRRCPVIDTWWQTETGGCMIAPRASSNQMLKPGSAATPMPGVYADIVDSDGVPLACCHKGHLVLKGPWPGLALGIYRQPGLFTTLYFTRFKNAYDTGDYALQDDDGYYWLLGRADEVIMTAGHRIGTAELEQAVASHSAVAEGAAVGVADAIKGEAIVLFVVLNNGYTCSAGLNAELAALVRLHIGPFASIRSIIYIHKLPKTRSGKVMRRLLKALLEGSPLGDMSTLGPDMLNQDIERLAHDIERQQAKINDGLLSMPHMPYLVFLNV